MDKKCQTLFQLQKVSDTSEGAHGTVIADRAVLARWWWQRAVGLLSRSSLADDEALIIPGCSAVHTYGMRFPIDLLFLTTSRWAKGYGLGEETNPSPQPLAPSQVHGMVVKVVPHVRPFRFAGAAGADTVIELSAGAAARAAIHAGDRLQWAA